MSETLWPSVFRHPRLFDPCAENITYLEYLDQLEIALDDGSEDDSALSDTESSWKTDIDADRDEDGDLRSQPPSNVRRFAEGLPSEEDSYLSLIQNERVVIDFVEHSLARSGSEGHPSSSESSYIAIIDRRSDGRAPKNKTAGHRCLTACQLREELLKPV